MMSSWGEYKVVEGSHGGLLDVRWYLEMVSSSYSDILGHQALK